MYVYKIQLHTYIHYVCMYVCMYVKVLYPSSSVTADKVVIKDLLFRYVDTYNIPYSLYIFIVIYVGKHTVKTVMCISHNIL